MLIKIKQLLKKKIGLFGKFFDRQKVTVLIINYLIFFTSFGIKLKSKTNGF